MTLWPIGGQIKAMCGQEPDEKILADNAQVAETLKKATDIRETVEAIEHLDVASNSPSNNETEDIMLKSASFSELETGSGIGKFFTYVTKTCANLTTYSRKLENYNGTIIFEIDIMKKLVPNQFKSLSNLTFSQMFWSESAVSPAENKCYFGSHSGNKCEF